MKIKLSFVALFCMVTICSMRSDNLPPEILLWPNGAPGSAGKTEFQKTRITPQGDIVISHVHKPSITPFFTRLSEIPSVAVIIAPGGGHSELWISHEGYTPAKWLSDHGIAAFALKYRLAKDSNSTYTVDREEVADIQRAIRLVRSHAKEWNIDTAKIGVMGFSAGGELAALAGMRYTAPNDTAKDPIDRLSDKPNFQALIYPGNIQRFAVTKGTPPAFMACGYNDRKDISEGLPELYIKYKQANIPAELHIYGDVGHGFGMRAGDTGAYSHWPDEFWRWLIAMRFIGLTK